MSSIVAKFNEDTSKWSISIPNLNPDDPYWDFITVKIGFYSETNSIVEFDDLSYGFDIIFNEKIIATKKWPIVEGLKHVYQPHEDQEFLQISYVKLLPKLTYTIKLWCNHNNEYTESTATFQTPTPPDYATQYKKVYGKDPDNLNS